MPSKNPKNAIRGAYYELLNNVMVMGQPIPCYDSFVPQTATKPYILLRNIFYNDGPKVKDAYLYSLGIKIEVHIADEAEVGFKQVDDITDKINRLVMPINGETPFNLSPHFAVIYTKIEDVDQNETAQDNKYLYTNTLIFTHLVEQITENN